MRMCDNIFEKATVNEEFVLFMQTFLNLKPIGKSEKEMVSVRRAESVLDCLNHFTMAKYSTIKLYKEVKAMIQIIHSKFMTEIFEKEKSFQREKACYTSAIRKYLD